MQDRYRLALNYSYESSSRPTLEGFRGPITLRDHALIVTALIGYTYQQFIPSQVGLPDLQPSADRDLDFDNGDHCWHSFEELVAIPEDQALRPASELLEACEAILTEGYDVDAGLKSLGVWHLLWRYRVWSDD